MKVLTIIQRVNRVVPSNALASQELLKEKTFNGVKTKRRRERERERRRERGRKRGRERGRHGVPVVKHLADNM